MEKALKLLKKINNLGFEAYLVGGSVRDYLLKRDSFDFDIATNALPEFMLENFDAKPIGIKFGTVLVIYEGSPFEVTTFRRDLNYYDNRHPQGVVFSNKLEEDAMRRDFTVNGMYMDKDLNLIDMVDGQKDLELKLVRTIGNPNERFNEDALRMIRAFYLVSKLNFTIDKNTYNAINVNRELIKHVSSERIHRELVKILTHENTYQAFKLMKGTKIHELLPGLKVGINFIVNNEVNVTNDQFFPLAFYLNKEVDEFWKLSNVEKETINEIINILNLNKLNKLSLYKFKRSHLEIALDINNYVKVFNTNKEEVLKLYDDIKIRHESELDITNNELMTYKKLGPGPWISKLRNELVENIVENKFKNNKEEILKYIKRTDVK